MYTIGVESGEDERGAEHDVEGVENVEGDRFRAEEVGEVGEHFY